jgi:hypothetical protein
VRGLTKQHHQRHHTVSNHASDTTHAFGVSLAAATAHCVRQMPH